MGLLNAHERLDLAALLLKHPDVPDPQFRQALLANLPQAVLVRVPYGNIARYHIEQIIQTLDGSVDLDNARLADGSWPLLTLLDNAARLFSDTVFAPEMDRMRLLGAQRAVQKSLHVPAGFARDTVAGKETLERIVDARIQFVDPQLAIRRLSRIIRAVCRVELPTMMGTGFLVGPDLVLTNYHVVEALIQDRARLEDVQLRFDYLYPLAGTQSSNQGEEGTLFQLAPEGVSYFSDRTELDFALLRVEQRLAEHPAEGLPGIVGRGWLQMSAQPDALAPNTPLFILQHPNGRRLESAYGWVVSQSASSDRVQYTTNTQLGSSGSPCFNERWELVALHRASVETANEGIPISAILGRGDTRQIIAASVGASSLG